MTDSRDYRKYLEKCFELVEEKNELRQKEINAQFREVNHTLTEINEHLKLQNGSIAKLKNDSLKLEKAVDEFHEFKNKFVWAKKRWYVLLLVLMISVLAINVLYDMGAINAIIEKLINKI